MKKIYFSLTLLLSFLIALSAIGGILIPSVYSRETSNWKAQGLAQDWVNLLIVAPLLVVSGSSALRGSLRGRLVWLGVLFANVYSFIIYSFFIHFGVLFPVYVVILGLSLYLVIFSVSESDLRTVEDLFQENWSRRAASILMVLTGGVFYLLWSGEVIKSLSLGGSAQLMEAGLFVNPVHVIDLALFLPGLLIVGILLMKKKRLGYFFAGPMLVSLVLISMNIMSVSLFLKLKGVESGYGVLPVFAVMAAVQLFITVSYLKKIKEGEV